MTPRDLDYGTPIDAVQVVFVHPQDTILRKDSRSETHDPSTAVHGASCSTEDVSGQTHDNLNHPPDKDVIYSREIRPRLISIAASSIYTAISSLSSEGSVSGAPASPMPLLPPKVGTRFSKEAARVLRQWLDTHKDHPFPSRDDREMLQRLTGLSNVQIKTWFTNARRRRKLPASPASSVSNNVRGETKLSTRPDTPIPVDAEKAIYAMDPLERWFDSPPEDEPASPRDIARAVSSGRQSSLHRGRFISSALLEGVQSDQASLLTRILGYFGLSRDSSREDGHEKSLHVPLERWVCSPHGPINIDPGTGQECCAYCGKPEPDDSHTAVHNTGTCQQRVFIRKDHLKQHLRLVHDTEGVEWIIRGWKAPGLIVLSRCGFCGIALNTWADREDHLADHFKLGQTMADWTGDWGFEKHIMDTIESFMPPYVIDYDRKTPFPFVASGGAPGSPRSAYELISLELAFFLHKHFDQTKDMPSNDLLQLQACRVIFASEALVPRDEDGDMGGERAATSWLRDLITFDTKVTQQARFGPRRTQAESRLATLKINGKKTLFEACPLEKQLQDFVQCSWAAQAVVPMDGDLQSEACRILSRAEGDLETKPPDFVANWLIKLITTTSGWLGGFKERICLSHQLPLDVLNVESNSNHVDSSLNPQESFGRHHLPDIAPENEFDERSPQIQDHEPIRYACATTTCPDLQDTSKAQAHLSANTQTPWPKLGSYILNDANHHRWLGAELQKWATTIMSLDNPNWHIPSDEEIQDQVRRLLYDE
ncbi:conserved hypothetical protein [Verticillium alfalfae VaMs.102]|uniref:Homeobox domain-containing protein n=1 Tax=Verticillium alfalfae (strain VaMs.102 / ATCC MYA-4576 / FGSC 10136) TaxID=526221 RepID=C9SQL1_VERA1|nr:conserved hypothetical protein [Verticillium alfalfae VaMs.102]EEY21136.1 conserved hypothetical protein [Verticillium alfalfae VaMs.102]